MVENEEKTFKKLRIFNVVMGCIHLLQVILILGLSNSFSLPITYIAPAYSTAKIR